VLRLIPLTILALLASAPSRADDGDIYLDFVVAPQLGWVSHPVAVTDATALPFSEQSMFALKPGVGVGVRRGFGDALHLGVGLDAAGSTSLTGRGVQIDNRSGDLLTAAYVELAMPVSAGWRFDSGSNLTGLLELQAGPLVTFWGSSAFADPNDLDDNGLPAKFPVDVSDTWHIGGIVRAQALFEARLWDAFVFAIGPSLGVSWADTVGVHVGLTLRPSMGFGGPL
jgi:hypothetical protein